MPSHSFCFQGSVQLAPYYDSNVFELPGNIRASYGMKLSGRLNHYYRTKHFAVFGELSTQGYVDGQYQDESKLIVSPELYGQYQLGKRWDLNGGVQHFQKSFQQEGPSYIWTNFRVGLGVQLSNRVKLTAHSNTRIYRISRASLYHFNENLTGASIRFQWNNNVSAIVGGNAIQMHSKDYPAYVQSPDSSLMILDQTQSDHGYEISAQAEYTGRIITGIETVFERRTSNSIIADYRQIRFNGYISGRFSRHTFYHLILQIVKKRYTYSGFGGITGYRDPEQPTENRLYGRIEQQLSTLISIFGQISYLKNETLVNRVYYGKTILEFGLKFTVG